MSTASTNRPNSIMTAERSNPWSKSIGGRNGPRSGLGDDGAADIKAHPWFRGIDWDSESADVDGRFGASELNGKFL